MGALAAGGCGGDSVPADGVAKVGDTVIKKTAYERVYPASAVSAQGVQAKVSAMQILLQAEWTRQEAAAQTVSVSDAAVRKAFLKLKNQAFKTEKLYKNYLRDSKRTEASLLDGVQQQLLMDKLTARAATKTPKVTQSRIVSYYNKHRAEFKLPVRRDLRVLVARREAQATQAKQELAAGASWDKVAVAYSIDPAVKQNRGIVRGSTTLGLKMIDTAVKQATPGKVTGPIKTQYGWFLFRVDKVTPATQQSLKDAQVQIQGRLVTDLRQQTVDEFVQDFQGRWRLRSVCADDYKIAECANGPERNPTPTQPEQQKRPSPKDPQGNGDK